MSYYGGGGGAPVPLSDAGDLLTHDGSGLVALPLGNEGQALLAGATGPEWGAVPAGPPGAPGADGATGPAGPAGPPVPSVCDARLTLTQGVPVTTSDVIGASTIYLTRYQGAHVALWDGSQWVLHEVPSGDVSLALSGLTDGAVYDVFLHDNAGTLTLSLSAAWADDVTRTDALAYQDGVRVLASDHTRRLVGTFVATAANMATDTESDRLLRNEAHPVFRRVRAPVSTDTWSYSLRAFRVWNNDLNCRVRYIAGNMSGMGAGSLRLTASVLQTGSLTTQLAFSLDRSETYDEDAAAEGAPTHWNWWERVSITWGKNRNNLTAHIYAPEGLHVVYPVERSDNRSETFQYAHCHGEVWI